jgi:hypothetical protein
MGIPLVLVKKLTPVVAGLAEGLMAVWQFNDGAGNTITDSAGIDPPINITITDTSDIFWGNGFLDVGSKTEMLHYGDAGRIANDCNETDEFTAVVWMRPEDVVNIEGPARLINMSQSGASTSVRNFMVGQGWWSTNPNDVVRWRVRSTDSDYDGYIDQGTEAGVISSGNIHHIVATRSSGGKADLYVDNTLRSTTEVFEGELDFSGEYVVTMASEFEDGNTRSWIGRLYKIALYNKYFTAADVDEDFNLGVSGDEEVDPPNINFASSSSIIVENVSSTTNVVVNTQVRDYDVNIEFSYTGTATSEELVVNTSSPVTIQSGDASANINVTALDNLGISGDVYIDFALTGSSTGQIIDPSGHRLVFTDIDEYPIVSLGSTGVSITLPTGNPVTQGFSRVELSRQYRYPVDVYYSLTGEATGNVEELTSSPINIPALAITGVIQYQGSGEELTGKTSELAILSGVDVTRGIELEIGTGEQVISWYGSESYPKPWSGNTGRRLTTTTSETTSPGTRQTYSWFSALTGSKSDNFFWEGGIRGDAVCYRVLFDGSFRNDIGTDAQRFILRDCEVDAGDATTNGSSQYCFQSDWGANNALLEYTTLTEAASAALKGTNITVRHCHAYRCGSDIMKPNANVDVRYSFLERFALDSDLPDLHSDGVQIRGGSNITFIGNTLYFPYPKAYDEELATPNRCFIVSAEAGSINGVTLDDNWIDGGGYTLSIREPTYTVTNITYSNNKIGDHFQTALLYDGANYLTRDDIQLFGNIWWETEVNPGGRPHGEIITAAHPGGFTQESNDPVS